MISKNWKKSRRERKVNKCIRMIKVDGEVEIKQEDEKRREEEGLGVGTG